MDLTPNIVFSIAEKQITTNEQSLKNNPFFFILEDIDDKN
jgi:hypothetical protein